ncbi:MAG: putative metal-binding motif-containing protein [Deltaproteobacteria bacterium]|nr:putative metal-binding motif-containing protein [Deltaproteobacteria bacterium]
MGKHDYSPVVLVCISFLFNGCSLVSDFDGYTFVSREKDGGAKGSAGTDAGTNRDGTAGNQDNRDAGHAGSGGTGGTGAGGTSGSDKCDGDSSCSDHGKCDDSSGRVSCVCDAGYAGERCERCDIGFVEWPEESAVCVDDPCDPYPCDLPNAIANGCVQTDVAGYECVCEDGFRWDDSSCVSGCTDFDGDGYGDGTGCRGPDCNDSERDVHPGADEQCDGIDNNCDGRTDCEGENCVDEDPCVDDNPCTQDTCDSSTSRCYSEPWSDPGEVSCDPDGDEEYDEQDGVCNSDADCVRLACRSCTEPEQCADEHCVCADESCSEKRCFGSSLVCQYVSGDESGCEAENVPAPRWGEGCSGDETKACDADAVCRPIACSSCGFSGCDYVERDSDCGNSEVCGVCGGDVDVCTHASSGTSCAASIDSRCDSKCNGEGECVSWEGNACGGTDPCTGYCTDGLCVFPTTSCGSGVCRGTCLNGTCDSFDSDCGTCCDCDESGTPSYDPTQDSDCGTTTTNPCRRQCIAIYECGFPGSSSSCGFGRCKGSCDGEGSCSTMDDECCSKVGKCNATDVCNGSCDAAGVCSSYGSSCSGGSTCDAGICGPSGMCRCSDDKCDVWADMGKGYELIRDLCSLNGQTCCRTNKNQMVCCPGTNCLFPFGCEPF